MTQPSEKLADFNFCGKAIKVKNKSCFLNATAGQIIEYTVFIFENVSINYGKRNKR
jgi:hypothetical protein